MEKKEDQNSNSLSSNESTSNSFWGAFDKDTVCFKFSEFRIVSMVGKNTGAQCRSINVDTIEKKVLIGSAIRSNGCIFNYQDGADSSSDEGE